MKIYKALQNTVAADFTAQLVAALPRDIDKKIFVFCESKTTLLYEKEIVKRTGGTFNTEVLSFSRYVSKKIGVDKYLSKSQATLLVRKLMKENENSLYRIKANTSSVPKDIYELISQLKAALVTTEDLDNIIAAENGAFASKLKDITTIYKAYNDFIEKNNLTDESGYLALMADGVKNDPDMKGAKVIVSGIPSFTKQTLKILTALNEVADMDFVCIAGGESYTNEAYDKIRKLFPEAEVENIGEYTKEALAISNGLFNPSTFTKSGFYSDKIKLISATSVSEECDKIAKRIRYELVSHNESDCDKMRYRDFAIVLSDVANYVPYIKASFEKYDIPVFVDETKTLSEHPVIGLIGQLIDVRRFNYLPKQVLAAVHNPLGFSENENLVFTKYVMDNAISRRQFKAPFNDIVAESVRVAIEYIYNLFKTKDTVNGFVSAVRLALEYLNVLERAESAEALLKEYGEGGIADYCKIGIDKTERLLDEVSEVLNGVEVTLKEFKDIIMSAASAVEISVVPSYNDTVFVGDYKSGRAVNARILFAPALVSSVPSYRADVALLNDRELIRMDEYKLVIEPKLQIVNKRERENIITSLMNFKDKLILSYPLTDAKGKPTVKSEVVNYLNAVFSDEQRALSDYSSETGGAGKESSSALYNYMSRAAGITYAVKKVEDYRERKIDDTSDISSFVRADEQAFEEIKGLIKEFDKEQSTDLPDEDDDIFDPELSYKGKFSATAIENYFACPYKGFVRNVLKLEEPSTGEAKVYEVGNIIHGVLEGFVKDIPNLDSEEAAAKKAGQIFDGIIEKEEFKRYLNKSQYVCIFDFIRQEAVKECKKVYHDVAENSDFKPIGEELVFSENSPDKLKPIFLEVNGDVIKIRGKIDRADRYGDFFRIIDYKTGSVPDKDDAFLSGRKIQLYLYANVFTKKGLIPAGAYYYKLNDDFTKDGALAGEYIGKTLSDEEIIGHSDKTYLESRKSENLGVSYSEGKKALTGNGLLTEKEFKAFTDYAVKVSENGAAEMLKGCIIPSPYDGECEYCSYKGLCGYDIEVGEKTRKLTTAKKERVISALEEKDE